jgi:beta-lactamase regulating signal transducer with metallopeptidase domain
MTTTLGWTLIHFLWQGALIALVLAGALALLRRSGSRTRYAVSCAAMLLMVISASVTFTGLQFLEWPAGQTPLPAGTAATDLTFSTDGAPAAEGVRSDISSSGFAYYLPFLVWAWLGGVSALSIRSIGGWAVAERLARRHTSPADAVWQEKFLWLADRLRVSRPVQLAVSLRAQVPAVVGWLRPTVLMPATMFTGLTSEQIEALLAHELAHVRRHDYIVNLMQTAAETLFFYHPAVWWVSRNIREERENCCDDLAVESCGDTLIYVRALAEMEQLRGTAPRLAVAASGGSLLSRAQRLLQRKPPASSAPAAAIAIAGLIVCLLAGVAATGQPAQIEAQNIPKTVDPSGVPSVVAARQTVTPTPPPAAPASPSAAQRAPEKTQAGSWLDEIEAAGFKNLSVDELIRLKSHDVDGNFIGQMRAEGFDLSPDQLVRFRAHDITVEFINEFKQLGMVNLTADDLVRLKAHDIDSAWAREIRSLGYPDASSDDLIRLRAHDISAGTIREAQKRFKDVTLDQLIRLRAHDILR